MSIFSKLNKYRAELLRVDTPSTRELLKWLDLWAREYDTLIVKVGAVKQLMDYILTQIDTLNKQPTLDAKVQGQLEAYIHMYKYIKEVK